MPIWSESGFDYSIRSELLENFKLSRGDSNSVITKNMHSLFEVIRNLGRDRIRTRCLLRHNLGSQSAGSKSLARCLPVQMEACLEEQSCLKGLPLSCCLIHRRWLRLHPTFSCYLDKHYKPFVYEEDGKIIGVIMLQQDYLVLDVFNLYVDIDYRGKEIG